MRRTITSPLANGASHPPTELVTRNLRRRGYDVRIDLAPVEAAAELLHEREALRGAQLLLVEDDAVNTLVTEATLRRWGAEVTLAANGEQAIEAIDACLGGFDAVLMDLHMPVMGGIAATIEIRKRYPATKLPIIALTADVLVSERDRALHHGMNEFVSKPIDLERLIGVLAYWVHRARAARS